MPEGVRVDNTREEFQSRGLVETSAKDKPRPKEKQKNVDVRPLQQSNPSGMSISTEMPIGRDCKTRRT